MSRILSVLILICLYAIYDSRDYNIPIYYTKPETTEKPKYTTTVKPKFPKIDINLYKDLVSAKNQPIDVVALVELAYRSPEDFECALSISIGSLYLLVRNNPLGSDGANVGIVTYDRYSNVHLALGSATAFSSVIRNPTPIFNAGSKYLNVDRALSLADSMLSNSNRSYPIKQIWVYISETSLGNPEATAKSLKYKGIEIFVFAVGPRVSYQQINAIASSPKHIIYSPEYCSTKGSLLDFINRKFFVCV
ncbi:unnamed protein product [Gordionus sp. m RMFG-2023]